MQPSTAIPPHSRPISTPDEELRVFMSRPRRSLWVSAGLYAGCLILGVAIGAAAWEGFATFAPSDQIQAPAPTPQLEPSAPVKATSAHQSKSERSKQSASKFTEVSTSVRTMEGETPKPRTDSDAEFNEDF